MARPLRSTADSQIYHVTSRGVGKQIIFEDEADRKRYLNYLYKYVSASANFEVIAWCLMSNHVHLLVRSTLEELSATMHRVNTAYALSYNTRYKRVGPLFQGRFKSEPVDDDAYLLTVVRYIHQNPVKAGLTKDCSYRWSSYNSYVSEEGPIRAISSWVLDLFGGKDEFIRFHGILDYTDPEESMAKKRAKAVDEALVASAKRVLGTVAVSEICGLEQEKRNRALLMLVRSGMSVRQVERLTGVSKSVVGQVLRDSKRFESSR